MGNCIVASGLQCLTSLLHRLIALGQSVAGGVTAFALNQGAIYAEGQGDGGSNPNLVAIDAATGATLWTITTGDNGQGLNNTIAVGNGLVFAGCVVTPTGKESAGAICAYEKGHGVLKWSYSNECNCLPPSSVQTPLVYANGKLYFGYAYGGSSGAHYVLYVNGGSAGEIAALNSTTGAVLWSVEANSSTSPVSIANGLIFATGSDGYVHKLRAATGAELWAINMASESSVSLANGVLYDDQQGSNNLETAAYAMSNGALLWSSPTGASTLHPPPIIANGTLYITNGSCGSVCAYGLSGG